jgi:hypothetical protein
MMGTQQRAGEVHHIAAAQAGAAQQQGQQFGVGERSAPAASSFSRGRSATGQSCRFM